MSKNYIVNNYELDDYQMQLLKIDSNALVIAGAGAGKTLTILGKINYLMNEKLVSPEDILVISFTNASVNDIKKKLDVNLPVFTFHKLAIIIFQKAQINYQLCQDDLLLYLIKEDILTSNLDNQKTILKFLHLNIPFTQFCYSKEFNSFLNLCATFINLWKTNNYHFSNLNLSQFSKLEKKILLIIFQIYLHYIEEKNSLMALDFDDLIIKATEYIFKSHIKYKYIIIDEFQDTSFIRLNLVQKISEYCKAQIIVVGDDWQSIYRFSGCDLNIFLNFQNFFANVKQIKLVNTYRNSQELIDIASKFILKNPLQITKTLKSSKSNPTPFILVPYIKKSQALKNVLSYLLHKTQDIMILSRNNHDIDAYLDQELKYENGEIIFNNYHFKYYTVHRSKGLESQYVILLNCNNETLGFPNKIENNQLITKIFATKEMPYAEERRLFYVALTRCKETCFILYAQNNPSCFIKELKKIIKKHLKKIAYFKCSK